MNELVNRDPIKKRCFVVSIIIIQLKRDISRYMPILYHIRNMFKCIVIFGNYYIGFLLMNFPIHFH